MTKNKQIRKKEEPGQMTQKDFKEENDFRKIEVVFYNSCALCRNSRLVKNPSKAVKYDLLVCTQVEPAFIVEASTVCNMFR
jgi:hypothetical protein